MSSDGFAEKVIRYHRGLHFDGSLPSGISIMNPYRENPEALRVSELFYRKYYDDGQPRRIILGINPGRFGGGITGIPFTDPKRLMEECGIVFNGPPAHEPSSVFVYKMIEAFGGTEKFYKQYYIHSVCPLGFTRTAETGREVNYNYYDSPALTTAVTGFITGHIRKQIEMGVETAECFCFGTGKNAAFLEKWNTDQQCFGKITTLEHPRFIMQYKSKTMDFYIDKYLHAFQGDPK